MQLPAVVPAVGRNWVKGWSRWKWCFSVGTDGSFICQLNHDWELRPLTNPEKSCELNCLGWFPCYVNSTRKGTTTHSIHSLGISTVNDTKAWRSFTQLWKLMAVFSDRDCGVRNDHSFRIGKKKKQKNWDAKAQSSSSSFVISQILTQGKSPSWSRLQSSACKMKEKKLCSLFFKLVWGLNETV